MASSTTSAFGLVALPAIGRLSPRVWTVLGLNPGAYTLQGTNTYLVGTGASRLLIDTGAGVQGYLSNLLDCMRSAGCSALSAILITHWHHDHTGGLSDVLAHFSPQRIPVYKHQTWLRGAAPQSVVYEALSAASQFSVEGATLTVLPTPGHTSDHAAFLLHDEHALFIGDCILGQGTTVFRNLYDYTRSLHAVAQLAPLRLYCGHGPVVDDVQDKVREYLQHRQQREGQLLAVLSQQSQPCDAADLVAKVYPPLSEAVLPAAVQNVVLTLEKLQHEGRIRAVDADTGGDSIQADTKSSTSADGADWSEKDYGELTESTAAMIMRKARWRWAML